MLVCFYLRKKKKSGTVLDLTCICLTHNTLSLVSFEQLFPRENLSRYSNLHK